MLKTYICLPLPSSINTVGMKAQLLVVILLVSVNVFSQREQVERVASYTMVLPRTASMENTEAACVEQARLKAIGEAFGYSVSETTLSNVSDENGKASNAFTVLTRTNVRGEWIRDNEPPLIVWNCNGGEFSVTATVRGQARALSPSGKSAVEFHACLRERPQVPVAEFTHGQSLYAQFRASQDGYLTVYYVDHTKGEAYRVLPAPAYPSLDHHEVKADRDYVLFDRAASKSFAGYPATVDLVMEVTAGKEQVVDELIAVYSHAPIAKPMLSKVSPGMPLPSLRLSDLENWLNNAKSANAEVVIKRLMITVQR
jgi:hypothetical protein